MLLGEGHGKPHAYIIGTPRHAEGHGGSHMYVTASARWDPPDLIPEHREAIDEDDHTTRRRKLLDLAKKPKPGTTIWRGEVRHKDDLEKPPSVGLHWSVNPDQVISPYDVPKDHHRVIWEAKVDHPEKQTIPRSHPIWYGKHQSMDSEAEVRLHPQSKVRVTRRYVHNGEGNSAQPYVRHPERSDPAWSAHDMDHHADVAHKHAGDDGLMEYHKAYPDLFSEKPKPREGHSEVLYHGATHPRKFPIIAPDSFAGETHVRTSTDWNEAYGHAQEKVVDSYGSDDPADHLNFEDIRVYRVEHRGEGEPHKASPTERHHKMVKILHDATEGPHVTGAKAAEPKLRFQHGKPTKNRTLQTLTVHHPKKGPVGRLEFYERPGHLEIQLLSVPSEHRGNGYGNHLMDELQRRFPGKPIDHGERTDAGQGWWDSYSHGKEVVNGRTMASRHQGVSVAWDHDDNNPDTWTDDYRKWTEKSPHGVAVNRAQEHVRRHVPTMEMELGSTEDATSAMQHMLRRGGHPDADEGFVMRHHDPRRGTSQAFHSDGQPGVALHEDRWDYGTLAHEVAHHLHGHEMGRMARSDEEAHGPDFIRHYQGLLKDFGRGAPEMLGEHYYRHLGRIRGEAGKTKNTKRPQKCAWCSSSAVRSLLWAEGMAYLPTCEEHDAKTRSHIADQGDDVAAVHEIQATAIREPSARLFGPTHGLDRRLFDGEHLKPDVRRYILETLGEFWKGRHGVDWDEWARVYFAGSEASEWTSETLEGNGDFDVLIGVDYDAYRGHQSTSGPQKTDEEITDELNAELRMLDEKTKNVMIPVDGERVGPFQATWYVNHDSLDIRKIKPYAAYDVTNNVWAVKPPHLESWSIQDFPEGKAFLDEAHAVAAYVRAIMEMPEPYRSQQGNALWEHLHSDRSRAFGPQGEGWYDPGNALEKYLDQLGLWEQLAAIHFDTRDHPEKLDAPADWSNDPRSTSV